LKGHATTLSKDKGWGRLLNGALIERAEEEGFELFITTDQNIAYQQNLSSRKISIIVLGKGNWRAVRTATTQIVQAVDTCMPGSYLFIEIA
jgi:hypothetical protein